MVNEDLERKLVVVGALAEKFTGEEEQIADYQAKVCSHPRKSLSHTGDFPLTKPQAFYPNGASIGLGDRLGLALRDTLQQSAIVLLSPF